MMATKIKEEANNQIRKWVEHVSEGWDMLPTWELARDSRRPHKKPLAFAMIANAEPFVQIIHWCAEMAMEMETHPCDSLLGGFIGDRMVIEVEGARVMHEPPFCNSNS
jgi:hypothetical protein